MSKYKSVSCGKRAGSQLASSTPSSEVSAVIVGIKSPTSILSACDERVDAFNDTSMESVHSPKKLSRYKNLKKVGEGGMGEVYAGYDRMPAAAHLWRRYTRPRLRRVRRRQRIGATTPVGQVGIVLAQVAAFARLDDTVATLRQVTQAGAVAVIGIFVAQVALFVELDNPVAAASFFTGGATEAAGVVVVALVAFFGVEVDDPITAALFGEIVEVALVVGDVGGAGADTQDAPETKPSPVYLQITPVCQQATYSCSKQ